MEGGDNSIHSPFDAAAAATTIISGENCSIKKNNDNDDDDCHRIWNDLLSWVMKKRGSDDDDDDGEGIGNTSAGAGGGYVHPALRLQIPSSSSSSSSSSQSTTTCSSNYRGVYATQFIKKGELLIKIPTKRCVLSGESILASPQRQRDGEQQKPLPAPLPPPSPWLRCVAAYLQEAEKQFPSSCASSSPSSPSSSSSKLNSSTFAAPSSSWSSSSSSSSSFRPYFQSLPKSYDDVLLNWTSIELDQHLRGTTLHRSILGGVNAGASAAGTDVNEGEGGRKQQQEQQQQQQKQKKLRAYHPIDDLCEQYEHRVEPFLRHIGIFSSTSAPDNVDDDDDDINDKDKALVSTEKEKKFEQFILASQCISTRGFHMTTKKSTTCTSSSYGGTSPSPSTDDDYDGPFLLPVIDLLNHDPSNKCTTLQRSTHNVDDDYFYMIAERDICEGEEVVHSYGDGLTSAQLLQTFGFVPSNHTDRIIKLLKNNRKGNSSSSSNNNTTDHNNDKATTETSPLSFSDSNLTPVSFDKKSHILAACELIKTEKIFVNNSTSDVVRPTRSHYFIKTIQEGVRKYVTAQNKNDGDDDEDDPTWDIHDIPHRPMNDTTPDEFLLEIPTPTCYNGVTEQQKDKSNRNHHLLTNELLTFIIAQYLPEEAYEDIFCGSDGNGAVFTHLDHSILEEDPYLRLLISKTLQLAIKNCAIDHGIPRGDDDWTDSIPGFIDNVLLVAQNSSLRQSERRRLYGKTIILEEVYHLKLFNEEMQSLWDGLACLIWDHMESKSTWLADTTLDSHTLEKDEWPAAKRQKKAI